MEVEDLFKNYGDRVAVGGLNIQVKEGEIFGLIGPNGAGKTTALRVISTLLQITSGRVRVFGLDVDSEPDEVRKIISYLPEDAGAYKNLTGRKYLDFMSSFFASGKERESMLKKGIEITDLADRIDSKVETYSKGMTRRLLIARAVMTSPRLAILDEPTSGLDVINAKEIRDLVKKMSSEGMSILLSSHNMFEVEFLCDRVALINEGVIIEKGTPDELKSKYGVKNIEEVFTEVVG